MSDSRGALDTARGVAGELLAAGALAVVLQGSHARGDAHPASDLDLYAIGAGPEYTVRQHNGLLVSVSWRTVEQERAAFRAPATAGLVVPAWRQAAIVADPDGRAAALQQEALAWTWEVVGQQACAAYVAECLTGLAEEVQKLVASLDRDRRWLAAVQRSVLALRLAGVLAVHHRLLCASENDQWELVAGVMGQRWTEAQGDALAVDGVPFVASCTAALELYALAAAAVWPLLDARQRAVVAHACALAGQPLPVG